MKSIYKLFVFYFAIWIISANSFAMEEKHNYSFFGVNATIKEKDDQVYLVKKEGRNYPAGIVFTPKNIQPENEISFEVDLKGNTVVQLQIMETDARGAYIKETVSHKVRLTEQFKTYRLQTRLSSKTDQIDVLVLTESQDSDLFGFKKVRLMGYQ